jgi:MFS family permease
MESVKPPTVESEQPPGVVKRAITASAIGNATEWFDYGIYAYGVSYIAESIFPGDAASTTLLAFMTFAVSFLVRPIGGLVWAAIASDTDRYWRSPSRPILRSGCGRPC